MQNVKVNHVANSFFTLLFKNPCPSAYGGVAATRLYAVSIRG
jgi:hypothetical protein